MINTPEPEYIVGLDIGTTKIAVVVGKENEQGEIEIAGFAKTESKGVKRGFVFNIEQTVQSIKTAIQMAEESSKIEIHNVIVGIAGHHVKSMQQRGYRIKENKDEEIQQSDIDILISGMHKLAINPGEQIIDVIPQEYTIDGEPGIKNPVGMVGTSIETNFHIITAKVAAVQNIMKCVEKAGLVLDALVLEPIASASSALDEEEKEAGVALVDIGGGTTDIAIIQDNLLRHTAVIPFGGEVVTDDIKEGCTIIRNSAEILKVKFGSAIADKNKEEEIVSIPGLRGRPPKEISLRTLASIIEARMEEIISQVAFEIRSSGYETKLIAGIVITGGGALLKHVPQLTEFITGKEVRVGIPDEKIAKDTSKDLMSPIYSTAVGLVRIGIDKAKNSGIPNENVDKNSDETSVDGKEDKKTKPRRKSWIDIFEDFIKPM